MRSVFYDTANALLANLEGVERFSSAVQKHEMFQVHKKSVE